MADSQPNFAAYLFGGIFIAVWIYGLMFGFGDWKEQADGFYVMRWFLWGLLGLVIAGGLYAARVTSEGMRVGIIVAVGIALGVLILAAILDQEEHIFATFATLTGAGLIVSALPRPQPDPTPAKAAPKK